MRVAFLGTPDPAVPALERLAQMAEVAVVVTQPDRPRGRSKQPQPSAVKVCAEQLGLAVHQPEKSTQMAELFDSVGPIDVAVIVAYGMLIRPDALAVPAAGFVNIHFSLLPRWRGAAPVHRAVEAGDERAGVTLMQLDAGLDTGPTFASSSLALLPSDSTGDLLRPLAALGADLLGQTLEGYVDGHTVPVQQDSAHATYASKIDPSERPLDVGLRASELVAKIHALSPTPGATVFHEETPMKILRAAVIDESNDAEPGFLSVDGGRLSMGTGDGQVQLIEIQPAGKKSMPGAEWARGRHGNLGVVS